MDPLAPPGVAWADLSAQELAAAAAASIPVTAGPPAAPQPYIPLLARLRRLRAGLHHAGSRAPVR